MTPDQIPLPLLFAAVVVVMLLLVAGIARAIDRSGDDD